MRNAKLDPLAPSLTPVVKGGVNVRRYGAGGKYGGGSSRESTWKPCLICGEDQLSDDDKPVTCYDCRQIAKAAHSFFRVLSTLSGPVRGLWITEDREEADRHEKWRVDALEKAEKEQRSAELTLWRNLFEYRWA